MHDMGAMFVKFSGICKSATKKPVRIRTGYGGNSPTLFMGFCGPPVASVAAFSVAPAGSYFSRVSMSSFFRWLRY